uniref:Complement factor H like 4 n=1 Tax=Sphaeramia orbicularis TaxID=375764 RepID=A0A672YTX0_9TELE
KLVTSVVFVVNLSPLPFFFFYYLTVCSDLPKVQNGHVTEETRKTAYQGGDVIRFDCDIGYISGPTITYVCSDGTWLSVRSGRLKPCVLPDDTPNGYYEITVGADFVFGATIKYFCNEGYQMISKESTRTCGLEGWSNHLPICEPLSCDPPPTDVNVTVHGLPENEGAILPDRFLTFSCNHPGMRLNGSSRLICGTDGKWDHDFPSCEDVTCELPRIPRHLVIKELPPANETMKVGHRLEFWCDTENPSQGTREITCLQSGQWSGNFPTCSGTLDCGTPPHLTDGDIKGTVRSTYKHGERVEYMCQNVYKMEGGPYKTCRDSEWIGDIRCIQPCTVNRALMESHNIKFKYRRDNKLYAPHGDRITFSCVAGTRHDGLLDMVQFCNEGVMNLPTCLSSFQVEIINRK